jgi:UDP-N-acetyl-D-galactosamine dehydrogenase
MREKVAVVGLGYVGLPLAIALARRFPNTVGFDINGSKVQQLQAGVEPTSEVPPEDLKKTALTFSSEAADLKACSFIIVAVPTPIDQQRRPDLSPVLSACDIVGKNLSSGTVVVFESTVYPGVTEDICGPALERVSNLKRGRDFKLGYSPERINPGDREHTIDRVIKVVSGEDAETLERVAAVYGAIVTAGLHRASSIKVAEAAKVIENTQRDLNIALMNELSLIFDRIGISTRDVLAAAATKWNFLRFEPGLVGGHCIGVDPYYLTAKAEELGYHPQVILAGRRINDSMGFHVAQRAIKMLAKAAKPVRGARIAVLGLTFKEDVPDIRNSRVSDIVSELRDFGVSTLVHDPIAKAEDAKKEYDIELCAWKDLKSLDGLILAVAHNHYRQIPVAELLSLVTKGGVILDVKGVLDRKSVRSDLSYWAL